MDHARTRRPHGHDDSRDDSPERLLLGMTGVSKRFPGVQALDDVSLELGEGEVLGLIGENGAGKSTLIKILAGIHHPETGTIHWQGKPVDIDGVQTSMDLGIGVIHQELNLAENVSIAENIYLGRQPSRFGWLGVVDRRRLNRMAQDQLDKLHLNIAGTTRLGRLSIGQRQMVEIAKALSLDAKLLVFDEPTSSLSRTEVDALFEVIRLMKRRGVGILYVSHRLAEIVELADRVEVLRDGKVAGMLTREEIGHGRMVRLMVGREVDSFYQHERAAGGGQVALRARDVVLDEKARPGRVGTKTPPTLSFELRAGEILGFAGLVGAGRTELAHAIFGVAPIRSGSIELDGRPVRIRSARSAIQHGLGMVPEDRKRHGLILEMAVTPNISMAGLCDYRRFGLLDRRHELEVAKRGSSELGIRATSLAQKTGTLSGGNQQKTVLARWLAIRPRVLILDEPTRGVDVGCKSEIYALMSELTRRGVAIMMISSEMEELLAMSDRVVVMHEGRITGELPAGRITEENIMMLAVGGSIESRQAAQADESTRQQADA